VFPDPADVDDERAWERVDAWRYWTTHVFRHGQGNQEQGVADTLWAAYNAVTELVDHSGGRLIAALADGDGEGVGRFRKPLERKDDGTNSYRRVGTFAFSSSNQFWMRLMCVTTGGAGGVGVWTV
jgi:hypothetical protein